MAQDDYYYEIQLTNKQLVFYFMAGATGLILSFLAGVMVGRGVDAAGSEVQAAGAKTVREERIVPEEAKPVAPPSAAELSYAQRLESDKPDEPLDRVKTQAKEAPKDKDGAKPAKEGAAKKPVKDKPAPTAAVPPAAEAPAPVTPATTPPKPAADTAASKAGKPVAAGAYTIQVGAFKEKAAADALVSRLKAKGYAAYAASPDGPEGGLFNVRVGSYPAKADAERVKTKLRDEEKFKPFILPN